MMLRPDSAAIRTATPVHLLQKLGSLFDGVEISSHSILSPIIPRMVFVTGLSRMNWTVDLPVPERESRLVSASSSQVLED